MPNFMMSTSIVSEESPAMDRHTDTETDTFLKTLKIKRAGWSVGMEG